MNVVQAKCGICNTQTQHPSYDVREMMFGRRETFTYFQCLACKCLQIVSIPRNLSEYYPDGYYSFATEPQTKSSKTFSRWLQKQRCRTALFGTAFKLNKLLSHRVQLPDAFFKPTGGLPTGETIRRLGVIGFSAKFLDVGCGAHSQWLENLDEIGFHNLTGVDPFIASDCTHGRAKIYKRSISEIDGAFDVITFHHSLEHIPNQAQTLQAARDRLTPEGICLVRIPIVPSFVWEKYGVNWVELDAPRHLFLHSVESLSRTAEAASLKLVDIVYDSSAFEFYGSELYARNIPLTDSRSPWVNAESNYFSKEEMSQFEIMASNANSQSRGGRAGFYFRAKI